MNPVIEVTDLVREFNGRRVLNGISFKVDKGDTMTVMGASGCGKSKLAYRVVIRRVSKPCPRAGHALASAHDLRATSR